jgi:hypothetical protein
MSLHPFEVVWIVINSTTTLLTLWALWDAYRARRAVKLLNGTARDVVAAGNTRREWFRLLVQILLLLVIVPGLFVDRDIPMTPYVLLLMSVPIVLLISTALDTRERRVLLELVNNGDG